METNGCGACSGFWKFIKPPHYSFFKEECTIHDKSYNEGGSSRDRYRSDLQLKQSMINKVKTHFYKRKIVSKLWYLLLCYVYFIAVRLFGYTQYNYKTNG